MSQDIPDSIRHRRILTLDLEDYNDIFANHRKERDEFMKKVSKLQNDNYVQSRRIERLEYAAGQMILSIRKKGYHFQPSIISGGNLEQPGIVITELVATPGIYWFQKIVKPRKKKTK